ncbi:hypothetical protein HDU77_005465 [Chytriomyces hyalinus]|nr:hypothetical protein HDU77_005465 [Chytriomyces hyalinus]
MPPKRLASNVQRLVLTATPRKVTLRVTFPTNTPSAATEATVAPINLSLTFPPLFKSSNLEDLNKPTPKKSFFARFLRGEDGATEKVDAKAIFPKAGSKQHVSAPPKLGLSFKNTNSFYKQETQPTTTPADSLERNSTNECVVATDEGEDDESDEDKCNDECERKYEPRHLEKDMISMSDYIPYQGYSPREVLQDFNRSIFETFPHVNKAVHEWYELVGLPKKKVYLDRSKTSLGILEFRLPGYLAKSLARHVGTRYMEWMNRV